MNRIKVYFGYNKTLEPKDKYTYVVGLVALLFISVYTILYILFIDSILVISISSFCVLEYILVFFLLKSKKYYQAKIIILFALITQVSVLAFFLFPQQAKLNYFYFLVTPITFLIYDANERKGRLAIISYNLIALLLLGMSEKLILNNTLIYMSEKSLHHYSTFSALANMTSIFGAYYLYATDLSKTHKDLKTLANTDSLTNIYNRRVLFDRGTELFAACSGFNKSFSFLILDIDHFKKVNDMYGHPVGDSVLVQITDLIKSNIRRYDVFARYGGEEFAIVCKNADDKDFMGKARHLKKLIQDYKFKGENEEVIKITVSMGIVSFSDNNYTSFEAMVQHADKALYIAKQEGRNRVVMLPSD